MLRSLASMIALSRGSVMFCSSSYNKPRSGAWMLHPPAYGRAVSRTRQRRLCATGTDTLEDGHIIEKELQDEAKSSYLSYAMSVMVGRALPDARDGLKPVHRRILYAMDDLDLRHNKPFRKSARVVGDVLGKYHPHGDQAVYDALVRMAQPFAMSEPLVDGHGNFGSVDNDPAAAMRYTECRLQRASEDVLLQDLSPAVVPFADNFDSSCREPSLLPARIPQLLVNGSQGIAVGIATKIPPHNLREVVAALTLLIADPHATNEQLLACIPGPDFPTGAVLLPSPGIATTYSDGKGSMIVRSKVHVEESRSGKSILVVTQLPYQVAKAAVIEEIAAIVEKGTVAGISDIQDESDRTGMRIAIEVKRGVDEKVVLNNLFKHTRLQSRFSSNVVALVDSIPEQMNLRRILEVFIDFRYKVVQKRAELELAQREARLHVVEGFLKAVDRMEEVVKSIRAASDGPQAKKDLQATFGLSGEQADAVLNMSLRRLTGLAVDELRAEQTELVTKVEKLKALLQDPAKIRKVMIKEANEVATKYGRERRTAIADADVSEYAQPEELIQDERCLLIISARGHIKRVKDTEFSRQRRGGTGKAAGKLRENDAIRSVLTTMAHDHLICIAADGSCHTIRAFEVPERSRTATGIPMAALLPKLKDGMQVAAVVPLKDSEDTNDHLLLMTRGGIVKRMDMATLGKIREGTTVMGLNEGDSICYASTCSDSDAVMAACSGGKVATFAATDVRVCGRLARGVRGKRLGEGQHVVGASVLPFASLAKATKEHGPWLLLASSTGHGKRVPLNEFRACARGAAGVMAMKLPDGATIVNVHVIMDDREDEDSEGVKECLATSRNGMMSRIALGDVSVYGRNARGVRIAKLNDGDQLGSITPCKYRHFSC